MKINKDSLRSKVNKLANDKSVSPNVILQQFFFDAFIKRLAKSKYLNNFVFKGGFLLSIDLGIENRSTMDLDFTLRNIKFDSKNIKTIFKEIISIDADDPLKFKILDVKDIRKEDEYGGFSVSLLGILENIKVNLSIDIATGDPITPSAITYKYNCIFDDMTIKFPSYNFETILAEKLETVLNRGITNSRSKDFYDIFIIDKMKYELINKTDLSKAFRNTCKYRNTHFTKEDSLNIIGEIKENQIINKRWVNYTKKNPFASDIKFEETIKSILRFINCVY